MNLTDAERERRGEAMKGLHRLGLHKSPLSGRPRKGETREQARARREAELAEREGREQDSSPLPARPVYTPEEIAARRVADRAARVAEDSSAPEPADDPRIARALAAGGHRPPQAAGAPGGPLNGGSPWLSRGAGPPSYVYV